MARRLGHDVTPSLTPVGEGVAVSTLVGMSRDSTPRARGTREWRTVPLPPDWDRVIRPRILHRDPACKLHTHCWGAPSTEVDHIGDPSDHSDDNLRGVCQRCHAHRTG